MTSLFRSFKACVAVLCLSLTFAVQANAQTSGPQSAQPTATTPPPAEKRDVKTYTLPPEKYQKAIALSSALHRLYFIGVGYSLLLLLLVLTMRLAPKLRDWAERISRWRMVQVLIIAPLLLLILDALQLPLEIYRQHLYLKYELSVQGWASWFWDWTKGEVINLLVATFLIWLLYAVIRRSPRRWWLYFWLAMLPLLVLALFVIPVIVDPLFNQFEPLDATQPALVSEIERVTARGGLHIPRERMFEMKASEKTKTLNAYVTGIGATKRVVVWDTTVEKMTVPQTLFVFGHEMGHYVLNHVFKTIIFVAVVLLTVAFLIFLCAKWMLGRWREHWSISDLSDWASLPLLMFLFVLFSFLASPVINTYSRHIEHEADVYGLEVTHGINADSGRVAAESFQILGETSLSDPNPSPFIKFWLYSHPPVADRLKFAREYDPWAKGESPQFVK